VSDIAVANRTWDRAVALAEAVGGRPVALTDLTEALTDVDVLLTSTGASTPILDEDGARRVMAARRDRPLLIVDIAVPRDVDHPVGALEGITLLDMDDLRAFADAGAQARRREVATVQELLDEELERYVGATSAREVAPMIVALRARAEAVRTGELERHVSRLSTLDEAQMEAVEAVTRGIISKLLHDPTVALKDAAGTPRGDRLIATLRDLFGFDLDA
jgi:glutamyl-tRNA reductase